MPRGTVVRLDSPEGNCANCDRSDPRCEDPISHEPLGRPVYRTPQGSCYNRDTLQRWFQTMPSDPLTRKVLYPHPDFAPRPGLARAPRSRDVHAAIAQYPADGVALVLPVIPEYYSARGDDELLLSSIVRSVPPLVDLDNARVYTDVSSFAEAVRLLDIPRVTVVKFTPRSLHAAERWFREYGVAYQALETDRSYNLDTSSPEQSIELESDLGALF